MKIEIEYIISETEKETYHFEDCGNSFRYVGIGFSRRNDKNDIWGDKWNEHFDKAKGKELKEFEDYEDDYYAFSPMIEEKIKEIKDKYNPCMHKTDTGKSYYMGQYGGKLPAPKIDKTMIKAKILEKISKFKVEL